MAKLTLDKLKKRVKEAINKLGVVHYACLDIKCDYCASELTELSNALVNVKELKWHVAQWTINAPAVMWALSTKKLTEDDREQLDTLRYMHDRLSFNKKEVRRHLGDVLCDAEDIGLTTLEESNQLLKDLK